MGRAEEEEWRNERNKNELTKRIDAYDSVLNIHWNIISDCQSVRLCCVSIGRLSEWRTFDQLAQPTFTDSHTATDNNSVNGKKADVNGKKWEWWDCMTDNKLIVDWNEFQSGNNVDADFFDRPTKSIDKTISFWMRFSIGRQLCNDDSMFSRWFDQQHQQQHHQETNCKKKYGRNEIEHLNDRFWRKCNWFFDKMIWCLNERDEIMNWIDWFGCVSMVIAMVMAIWAHFWEGPSTRLLVWVWLCVCYVCVCMYVCVCAHVLLALQNHYPTEFIWFHFRAICKYAKRAQLIDNIRLILKTIWPQRNLPHWKSNCTSVIASWCLWHLSCETSFQRNQTWMWTNVTSIVPSIAWALTSNFGKLEQWMRLCWMDSHRQSWTEWPKSIKNHQ